MDITIRRATLQDLPTLLDINLDSFHANAAYDPHIDMNWIHSSDAREHFTNGITKPDQYTIIAEVGGKPVGYLVLVSKLFTYRMVKVIELDNLSVLPAFQSKGIGKRLIEHAKSWAKEQGYHTMYACAYIKNEKAVKFYKREGFEPIDISLEMPL